MRVRCKGGPRLGGVRCSPTLTHHETTGPSRCSSQLLVNVLSLVATRYECMLPRAETRVPSSSVSASLDVGTVVARS